MKILTAFKKNFQREGEKQKFSFVRIFLVFLFFVLIVGGFFVGEMMESFLSREQKSETLTTQAPQSVPNDFSALYNQTNETKKEVANETMFGPFTMSVPPVSVPPVGDGNFTNKTAVFVATNRFQSGNEFQSILQSVKAYSSSKKKTVEKKPPQKDVLQGRKPLQEDAPQPDSEEKIVEKNVNYSLFQGEKKLENLLLKAEEETAKGNYELAKFFYEKYLEEKKDARVYNNYGGVLFLLGNYEEAEKAFITALSLEQNPVFKLNLILTKIKLNKTKEACQMFKEFRKEPEAFEEMAFIKNFCFF